MAVIVGIGLEDEHLNDRGRINRTAVRGGLGTCTTSPRTFGLLHDLQLVCDLLALLSDPIDTYRLVGRLGSTCGRHFDRGTEFYSRLSDCLICATQPASSTEDGLRADMSRSRSTSANANASVTTCTSPSTVRRNEDFRRLVVQKNYAKGEEGEKGKGSQDDGLSWREM
jgi:hypothetical protein